MIQQVPWIERKFNFDFPVGLFPVIYSRLEGSITRLQKIVTQTDYNHGPAKIKGWTVKEHLGHLGDLESLWWRRLEDFKFSKEVLTAADMSNEKTNTAGHNEKTLQQLLEEFSTERQKILEAIYWYDDVFLSRISRHPRLNQPVRVIDILYFVAEHDDHHIARIQNLVFESV
jgi:uncharacterized damage-inducible protein DinB